MENSVDKYKDIISYVSENSSITSLVSTSQFFPLFTTNTDKCSVVTNFTPTIVGVIITGNMEFKVISPSRDEMDKIVTAIINLMGMRDLKYKTYKGVYFYSEYAGGGEVFNPDYRMYENSLIFNVKWRCL